MAMLDLSLVTQALIRVVKAHVSASEVWTGRGAGVLNWRDVPVVPLPPDQSDEGFLSVYLYHVSEDAHFKNQANPGTEGVPLRYSPMGLNLFYQLSARAADNETAQYQAQLLMGLAVKALHDYPSITDGTAVEHISVFDEECRSLRGDENRIRLSLNPIAHTEAAGFWTAGSGAMRLSAYYQASVILLEPEEAPSRAARVLRYGVQTFVTGAPRLDGSENTVRFALPVTGESEEVRLRPAEVPPGSAAASRVAFTGVDLAGDETTLLLRSARWTEPLQADDAWGIVATPNQVLATVRDTLGGQVVLPGIYAASVRVVRQRGLPDGSVRDFQQSSNETPFAVAPRIDDPIEVSGPDDVVTVRGYIFQHAELDPEEDILVYLGIDRLQWRASGPLEPMAFTVVDASTLQLRLPEGSAPGEQIPFRLLINGVESPPRWIEVPP